MLWSLHNSHKNFPSVYWGNCLKPNFQFSINSSFEKLRSICWDVFSLSHQYFILVIFGEMIFDSSEEILWHNSIWELLDKVKTKLLSLMFKMLSLSFKPIGHLLSFTKPTVYPAFLYLSSLCLYAALYCVLPSTIQNPFLTCPLLTTIPGLIPLRSSVAQWVCAGSVTHFNHFNMAYMKLFLHLRRPRSFYFC